MCDASPIQYLYQTGLLHLLGELYARVIIPPAVVLELERGKAIGVALPDVRSLPWIEIRTPEGMHRVPPVADLGAGEREVLALGLQVPDGVVILDERLGRSYAASLKLNFTGTPTPILVGSTSTLTASYLLDSAGSAVSASNLNVMAGVPITFNNNQNGTLSNAQAAIQNVQSVQAATESGSTVTITTSGPHGFSNGQTVTVSGVGVGYDGQFTIGGAAATTFTYTAAVTGLPSLASG